MATPAEIRQLGGALFGDRRYDTVFVYHNGAQSREHVRQAHALALAHGGRCEGPPGLRPEYHADYYGAYFRDPEGNKLCVVCHRVE